MAAHRGRDSPRRAANVSREFRQLPGDVDAMKTCLAPAPLGLAPSFGFGDRLGLATPGHLAALKEAGGPIKGIFAQQSIREMERTKRTPETVMQAAADSLAA